AALRRHLRPRERPGRSQLRVARPAHPVQLMGAVVAELARFSRRNTLSAIGGFVGLLIIVVALAAPFLAPRDPLKADFRRMNKPPDAQSLLGTDQVGRDTLSR